MNTPRSPHSAATVAAIASLAFITACVAHEAVGHGGMCLMLGGDINRLSSVYFRCSRGGPLTDAAGPLMNLALGTVLWLLVRAAPRLSVHWRLFLVLAMAFNLFWGAGQMILSAVTNRGDYAFALRELSLEPQGLWRWGLAVLGAFLYICTARAVRAVLPSGVSVIVPYFVGGAVACLATLCYTGGPRWPALVDGVQEGFGTGIGLLLSAHPTNRYGNPDQRQTPIGSSNGWLFASVSVTLVFFVTLGRGFVFGPHS